MKNLAFLTVILAGSHLVGMESATKPHGVPVPVSATRAPTLSAVDMTLESLPPMGLIQPMLPGNPQRGKENEANLIDVLQERLTVIDGRLKELSHRQGGTAGTIPLADTALIREERKQRDEAFQKLMEVLQHSKPLHPVRLDQLSTPGHTVEKNAVARIDASNRLSMLDCYHELIAKEKHTPEELAAAIKLAEETLPEEVQDGGAIKLHYHRAWFRIQACNKSAPEGRPAHRAKAQEHIAVLEKEWPGSVLTSTAKRALAASTP